MKIFLDFLNDWLPTFSVIISAVVSYFVASNKSRNEIKKERLQFAREDKKLFNENFALLISHISRDYRSISFSKLIETNALLITVAPKNIIPKLIELDDALKTENYQSMKKIRNELLICVSKEK